MIEEFCKHKKFNNLKLAEQYFSKNCIECGKAVRKKDEIAMNLKLVGREINKFKCKKCLIKDLKITKEDWNKYIEDFKTQGCNLF